MTKTSQTTSYLHYNDIIERKTLNDSCHKHAYEGVMLVLCTPLQVKCYQHF